MFEDFSRYLFKVIGEYIIYSQNVRGPSRIRGSCEMVASRFIVTKEGAKLSLILWFTCVLSYEPIIMRNSKPDGKCSRLGRFLFVCFFFFSMCYTN